jgi:hypothetical protein
MKVLVAALGTTCRRAHSITTLRTALSTYTMRSAQCKSLGHLRE